jgi:hypothetical protein
MDMSFSQTPQTLDHECTAFSNYLIHRTPTPYILAKYREAHQASPRLANYNPQPFDQLLVALSAQNAWTTAMVDAYAALCYRNAMVRKKMVVLLAILESSAPTYAAFDEIDSGGARMFLLRLVMHGVMFALTVLLALLFLLPLHLGFELRAILHYVTARLAGQLEALGNTLPTEHPVHSTSNVPERTSELPFLH